MPNNRRRQSSSWAVLTLVPKAQSTPAMMFPLPGRAPSGRSAGPSRRLVVLSMGGLWLDTDAFDDHYLAGERFGELHLLDAAVRDTPRLRRVYRDELLPDDLYEDWALLRHEELKDKYKVIPSRVSQLSLAATDLDGLSGAGTLCCRKSHPEKSLVAC
jgi:hypothetical protein